MGLGVRHRTAGGPPDRRRARQAPPRVPATAGGPIYLVQLLLPLYDNSGEAFPGSHYEAVRTELTDRFGGLTAYSRAPAQGLWAEDGEAPKRDDIVVYEVMAETLDRSWWRSFRKLLEGRFEQEELVIRSQEVERL